MWALAVGALSGALLASGRYSLVPVRIFFSEQELPRNATNKVLKREIKAALLATLEVAS